MKKLKMPLMGLVLIAFASVSSAAQRSGEITVKFHLSAPVTAKNVRLWIPYPTSGDHQRMYDVSVKGNFTKEGVYKEKEHGDTALYAEWDGHFKKRVLTYRFKIKRSDFIMRDFPKKEKPMPEGMARYLRATSLGPTSGKVKTLALRITQGQTTILGKARSIYNWIVKNMYRDESVKGCGYGKVERLITVRGGKCADISSVFVALSRSAGVPAREMFSIRMPAGKTGDMTKSQHCWAEFYEPGYGWVPVDPADVRKAMLQKKTKNPDDVKDLVKYFFGGVDDNRVVYGTGRDVLLSPHQDGGRLDYFMYPYAEADGKPLSDDLFGFNLGYKISFKEL